MDRNELDTLSRAVTHDVLDKLDQRPALAKLFQDYPEIKADPDYALLADRYYDAFITNGEPAGKAIAMAGEAVAEKFGLGKFATEDRQTPSGRDEEETSESDVIAAMAAARPHSREAI